MTVRFRLDRVRMETAEGAVAYSFPSDLTVLSGPTGVGKTSLLELIKFGFGLKGRLAPVARESVSDIILDVQVGDFRLRLARNLDPEKRNVVRVTDLVTQERLADHHTDAKDPQLNSLLMLALGLPDDMRAAARSQRSVNQGSRISFGDIFSYLYVPQSDINRDIANSQESYREPKRKAVFELLFGLTDSKLLDLRSSLNGLNSQISVAETEYKTVRAFLHDSRTSGRQEAEIALVEGAEQQRQAEVSWNSLRETALSPATDRETQALRDLLSEAERGLADARASIDQTIRDHGMYMSERRRIAGDLARLHRMQEAGDVLADIEFAICPRCMQSLAGRGIPDGHCRVCLLPDPVSREPGDDVDTYEARQLADQLAEVDEQLLSLADQLSLGQEAVLAREALVADLTSSIDSRTSERITPRLQAFADSADQLAKARARQIEFESVLRQWDRADDIANSAERLRRERDRVQTEINISEAALNQRKTELIEALSEEFRDTVVALGIPSITSASISPTNYLPLLNGQPFANMSSGGGIITAAQVAYWLSLLTVALRWRDTSYPSFLILDSPRLALNTAEALSEALYRRIRTQVDANPGVLQIIVADNELPQAYRADFGEIGFDYANPTVSTIPHPGPAGVTTLEVLDDAALF